MGGAVKYVSNLQSGGTPATYDRGSGYNWIDSSLPTVTRTPAGEVAVTLGASRVIYFTQSGSNYTVKYGVTATLSYDNTLDEFTFADGSGTEWKFDDGGQLLTINYSGGDNTAVTGYTASGQIAEMTRTTVQGGVTRTDKQAYAYANDQITTITFTRTISGVTTNIRREAYVYYTGSEPGNQAFGSAGDLKTIAVQLWNGSAWVDKDVAYYRYYKSGDANGFVHGVKYVVGPGAYARMVTDSLNPLTATNVEVASYADNYYEYNDVVSSVNQQRVTKSIVKGGLLTYSYAYTNSAHANGFNNWKLKAIETRPDGSTKKTYSNFVTQTMLTELASGSDNWIEYHEYDSEGNEIQHAMPSAVTAYNDASANLAVTLQSSAGLIHLTDYYNSTTATETTAGGVKNYPSARKLKKGSGGTAVKLNEIKYFARYAGSAEIFPLAEEKFYLDDAGTVTATTTFAYTWHTGTTQVKQRTTTWPVVTTSQNGSNSADSRVEIFDTFGYLQWTKDERGFIAYQQINNTTGASIERIEDCDGAQITLPSGWSTPAGGGLHLVTNYESDDLGRTTQVLGPPHNVNGTTTRSAQWTVYQELTDEIWNGHGYATGSSPSYTFTLVNPVTISSRPENELAHKSIQATRASSSGKLVATDSFPQSSWVRLTVNRFNNQSQRTDSRLYHLIPSSGDGSPGTNYNQTDFGYDAMNRQNRVKTPGGTITRTVFDVRELMLSAWIGTDDTGATDSNPAGSGSPNNMKLVSSNVYDGGSDGGDGNLTQTTHPVDATSGNDRVTSFTYDFRNRQATVDGEVDFFTENTYDNLDRVTRVDRYNTSKSSANLIGRQDTSFDARGRVYRTTTYAVTVGSGTVGAGLSSDTWYSPTGQAIKQVAAGTKNGRAFSKTTWDGVGRETGRFIGYFSGTLPESYSDAGQVTASNKIFNQVFNSYDEASNLIQTDTYQRFHDSTGNGLLNFPTGAQPKARVAYMATWFDGVSRPTSAADYGTNNDSSFTRPASAPAASDTILVTLTSYNSKGEAEETTDAAGKIMRTEWDQAARQTKTIENYVAAGGSTSDQNVTTEFTYNSDGRLATLKAKNAITGDQTTTYAYGVILSGSALASNDLVASETYPDSIDSSDKVSYEYNRQGQRIKLADQRGTVHEYSYDTLGRPTQDRVTTLGTGVDSAVRRIAAAYESRGLMEKTTSYDNPTVGSGNVVNDIQNTYNSFSQLITQYQQHGAIVNTGTSPNVQYAYENGSAGTIRRISCTYPNGRVITYDYGTANSDNDLLSRIEELQE